MSKYVITGRPDYFVELGWDSFVDVWTALDDLDGHDLISFDTETTGLGSALVEKINALQLGTPTDQYVVDVHTVDIQKFKKLLESKTLIGHNLKFDIPYLYWSDIIPNKIYDSLVAEDWSMRGLEFRPDRAKDLGSCLKRHLGIEIDKSLQRDINQGLISVEAIEYAATDVEHLFKLREKQIEKLEKLDLLTRVTFECSFILSMCYWEFSGVKVDPDKLYEWCRDIEADEVIVERQLKEYSDINWGSSAQVGEVLKQYGIEEINEETGKYKTGKDVLEKSDEPVVKLLLEHRTHAKMVSTYGRKWFHYILPDGRIHTRYNPSVETGRVSSGDTSKKKFSSWDKTYVCEKPFPNLQNVVGDNRFRRIFVPKAGNVFVDCDYSAQETVLLADQAGEKNLIALLKEGRDPHSYALRMVYPKIYGDISDEDIKLHHAKARTDIKPTPFTIAYGGNELTLAADLGISVSEAKYIIDSYFDAFPDLLPYFKKCYDFAWQHGYMPTDDLTGGKRFFDRAAEFYDIKTNSTMWDRYTKEKAKDSMWYRNKKNELRWYFFLNSEIKKNSVNTKIQGTGAVMVKLANMYIYKWINDNNMWGKVKIPLCVHDSITLECHKKSAERVQEAVVNCMIKAGDKCLKHLSIKVDSKICTEWSK